MPAAVDKPAPDSTRIFLKEGNNRAKASTEGGPSGKTLTTCRDWEEPLCQKQRRKLFQGLTGDSVEGSTVAAEVDLSVIGIALGLVPKPEQCVTFSAPDSFDRGAGWVVPNLA